METLQFIYFILGILLIISGIVFGFLWYISQLQGTIEWLTEQAREEREKLSEGYREQLVDQLEIMKSERKDLYDRLQAGTLPQYKEHVDAPNEIEDTTEDETIPLDEAKDDLMGIQDSDG